MNVQRYISALWFVFSAFSCLSLLFGFWYTESIVWPEMESLLNKAEYARPVVNVSAGYVGGAIGSAIIAASALLCLVYLVSRRRNE